MPLMDNAEIKKLNEERQKAVNQARTAAQVEQAFKDAVEVQLRLAFELLKTYTYEYVKTIKRIRESAKKQKLFPIYRVGGYPSDISHEYREKNYAAFFISSKGEIVDIFKDACGDSFINYGKKKAVIGLGAKTRLDAGTDKVDFGYAHFHSLLWHFCDKSIHTDAATIQKNIEAHLKTNLRWDSD